MFWVFYVSANKDLALRVYNSILGIFLKTKQSYLTTYKVLVA